MSETLYDARFQNLFLAFALRDAAFLERVVKDLRPELFSNEYAQRLIRILLEFHEKEKSTPGDLVFHILDDYKNQGFLPEALFSSLNSFIDDLFALPLQNRTYVLKEYDRFLRHQLFRRNVLPAAEYVKAGKFDEAEALMREAFLSRASEENDLGALYEQDPTARVRRRQEEDGQRFWWLVKEIDARIRGIRRGELGVLQSQESSGGKSAALVFLARQVAFQNKRVLIYTLEMSKEDYEDRLDMCIAGLTKDALTNRQVIATKLSKMFKQGGRIWIKQFPGGMTSVSDLRRHKRMLENTHGFHADLVILDYADELCSEKKSKASNSFEVGKEIYSKLRGWAVKDDIGIWTGMQSTRSAADAAVVGMQHSGESIAKAWIADLIISINRTPKEAEEGLTRLAVVKNRSGAAKFTVTVNTDFERMQFISRDPFSG